MINPSFERISLELGLKLLVSCSSPYSYTKNLGDFFSVYNTFKKLNTTVSDNFYNDPSLPPTQYKNWMNLGYQVTAGANTYYGEVGWETYPQDLWAYNEPIATTYVAVVTDIAVDGMIDATVASIAWQIRQNAIWARRMAMVADDIPIGLIDDAAGVGRYVDDPNLAHIAADPGWTSYRAQAAKIQAQVLEKYGYYDWNYKGSRPAIIMYVGDDVSYLVNQPDEVQRLLALKSHLDDFRKGGFELPGRASYEDLRYIRENLLLNTPAISILEADDLFYVGQNGVNPHFGRPTWRGTQQALIHAEGDVLNQLVIFRKRSGITGGTAYLAVDPWPCAFCIPDIQSPGRPKIGKKGIFPQGVKASGLDLLYVETSGYTLTVDAAGIVDIVWKK